jgi:DNA-binding beta-propeller fold protein YncE
MGNHAIRMIDTGGYVTTLAGSGQAGYADGTGSQALFNLPTAVIFNAADGMTYVADSHNNCIRRIDSSGNVTTYAGSTEAGRVDGSLAQARFDGPVDLVINNGYMYVSDSRNNCIRRIDMANGQVSTYIS